MTVAADRAAGAAPGENTPGGPAEISRQAFEQLVERVYALLLLDLKIENERRRAAEPRAAGPGGW